MKLSEKQAFILGQFEEHKKSNLDELMAVCSVSGFEITRAGVITIIHAINSKIAEQGRLIKKTSGVGRGKIAEYELVKL